MLGALQTVPNQVLLGGTLPATCSQLPQPQDTPALGTKPVRLQGCDTSPAQDVLRGTESECLFYSVFVPSFELEYTVNYSLLDVLFFPFPSITTCFISTQMYIWFVGVFFFIGYYRACSKFPCVTQWVLVTYFINSSVILHALHLCILVTKSFLSKSSWAIGSFVSNFSLYLEVIS